MSYYIITTRGIRGNLISSEPGPTRFLKIPDKQKPHPSHEINCTAFIPDIVGTPAAQKHDDIVVFVHGYNVTQVDLFKRHRSIRTGLMKKGCTINLAHSTGGFIIREAFDDADERDCIAKNNWSVSQICFAAADVSSKEMAETSSNSNSLDRHCVRLTKDHNPYDIVLKLSNVKRIGVAPRAGRVGLPETAPAKAVGVDCGARFLKAHPTTYPVVDPISHGWYFDDPVFLKDLTLTLTRDMDRNVIPTRVTIPTLSLAEK